MRIDIPKPKGKSPLERIIRTLAMLLVFLVVVWAFYVNNENVIERLEKTKSVWDETGQMNEEDLDFLKGFVHSMKESYGIMVKIQVVKGDLQPPEPGTRKLYIGISPSRRQVAIQYPPLLRPALGEEFMESLQNEQFAAAFDSGDLPRELKIAVTMIWSRLAALDNKETTQ